MRERRADATVCMDPGARVKDIGMYGVAQIGGDVMGNGGNVGTRGGVHAKRRHVHMETKRVGVVTGAGTEASAEGKGGDEVMARGY